MPLLAFYKDKQGREPVDSDLRGNSDLTFPKTKQGDWAVVGRDTVEMTVYVRNEHRHAMELRPISIDPDMTIVEYPRFLKPDDMGKVVLSFHPSADRIDPLTGKWDFEKVVYGKEQPQPQEQ